MTNEEKSMAIANDNCTHICLADCSAESYYSSENDCYESALQAMQWKDKQYKWHKVADGDLPNKSDGEQVYLCQIANNKGILKDPLLRVYYCGEFVDHISLAPMSYDDNVIAWMELPEYTEE